jgi:hypothetical protein
MTIYICSRCGISNTAFNDITGIHHDRTSGKTDKCGGIYYPKDWNASQIQAFWKRKNWKRSQTQVQSRVSIWDSERP